ncbi:phosphoglucosamine mutase [Dokdonella fugitiva]|uniref:Phosphoglucosamine mutase n=1 Tax=Dokdonella fugitiva TaxID=328517 RepID=A0A839EZ39_9GAMM|nr:phosphoglucosamine mutase [Dokdonella fugitiva]MBA8886939.1 phosphoglucosamine mutase [Dokdonella fugitiva]
MNARRYFGTDGIRGRVGEWPITAEFMLKLGRAVGSVLAARGQAVNVVIGKDTRVSGYMFESALEAGLVSAGAGVSLLGPMPTPAVAYLTRSLRASAGIVISASHNPHHDNGIKFFSAEGEKLDDDVEAAIEAELDAPFTTVASESIGKVVRVRDAVVRYAEFCKGTVPAALNLRGLGIVLDCAHGATYQIAPTVFGELGAKVTAIGAQPDGLNINRDVGSTHPQALQRAVVAAGADLGIAFDGDGDRVQMVDRRGELVDGDQLLYVLASDWHASGRLRGPLVGTLMSNYGLERAMGELGVPFIRANVGDRYVLQQLKQHHGVLGGETSGHILTLDRASSGDAIVSALQVLDVLRRSGRGLDEAVVGMRKVAQTTVNVRVAGGAAALVADARVQQVHARVRAELEGQGRVVLRPSGTEPLVRVTVEAGDADLVERLAGELADAVRSAASTTTNA